jgi:glycosyltransferase involved in cell wall biosynthesis
MSMPQNAPKVSIILPTYNGSAYIHQAIESCLNQTYTDLELIIIDDASTDHTPKIVQSFSDPRLILVRLDKNQGHIAALNKGFALSRGDFLTWTSDDNYYALQAISMMVQELTQNKAIDFVYTRYHVVDEAGNILRQGRTEEPAYLDIDNCVGGCFLYRRKVYEQVGDFHEEAFLAEDYEYWLRVRRKFKMKKLDEILYFYREHPKSLTGVHKEERVQKQVQRIREEYLPLGKKIYFKTMRQLRRLKQLLRA